MHWLWCLLTIMWMMVSTESGWVDISTSGKPNPRDEAGSFIWKGTMCMFGGRSKQPIDCYDPVTKKWTRSSTITDDIHHVQPVVWKNEVYIIAAWHGPFPAGETQIPNVLIYNPDNDTIRTGCKIPKIYARGAAGCVVYDDIFYIVNGAVNGHEKQYGAYAYWNFTRFDAATCTWSQMKSRPRYHRDHFEAAMSGSKIVIAGGRDTPRDTSIFHWTVGPTEWYDLKTGGDWHEGANITTRRAGTCSVVDSQGRLIVLGGETDLHGSTGNAAYKTVERYDLSQDAWTTLPSMLKGRHTSGGMVYYPEESQFCKVHTNIDCKDEDMPNGEHDNVSDPSDCCALCKNQSGCRAWTLYPDRKVCYLKYDCKGKKSLDGAVSGGDVDFPVLVQAAGVGKMGGSPQLDDTETLYYGGL